MISIRQDKKYPLILQRSEENCGAACLATVVKYYGRTFSFHRIREAVGTGQLGTTLLGLRRGAEALGFNARQIRVNTQLVDRLNEAPLPGIIHWKGYHWVVIYGRQGNKYIVADPGVGVHRLSRSELDAGWTNGIMLLLMPDEVRLAALDDDQVNNWGRFWRRVLPYRQILIQAVLINFVIGLLSLAFPFLLQILTDDVLVRGDRQLLTVVAIGVIAMNLFASCCRLVQSNLIAHFAQRLQLGFILEFGRQILQLPLTYYETRRSGEIVSRLRDIRQINNLLTQTVTSLPSQIFIGLISLGLMLTYSSKLTLIAAVMTGLMFIPVMLFLPTLQHKTRTALVLDAENQGFLVETFKGAMTLKTSNASPQAWSELQSRFGRLASVNFRTNQIAIANSLISQFISAISSVILLWFGSSLVISQQLSIGQLMAFNSMNANLVGLVATIIGLVDEFAVAQTAIQRLDEIIDATPETNNIQKEWVRLNATADIVCEKLNFHYPGRVDLLENFSVTIPGGKFTALIGQSGCGKSTVAKIIANLYPVDSGSIRFGKYHQRDLALESLRQQIVLIPQEAHFWSRSILDNFRFSYPYISFEQIVTACQITGADEFITRFPDGYHTVLGEFGTNMSGGQRQRLAIARAIVSDPPILILDESTGALDPVSETQVLSSLLAHRRGKTTITITHRPNVIARADWIILMQDGVIKVQGSPTELRSCQDLCLQEFLPN
ncbi:MAG: peptidase domain-containing ABC transporter [Cyanobacteria bacterium P01_G01_bin.67]